MSKFLEVTNVSKSFIQYGSELKRVISWLGIPIASKQSIDVLKDISFSIQEGESIGILGQNGAGKSTLLKIITGTLSQSSGNVSVNGRIAAILELGMGFHPELTGRQNVYHSAGLMGFCTKQIDTVIDEIEAFAEIGEYFDKAVRMYSSGMQVRVAFSVATAFRPEILIIDEALSVGDSYFQHKCFKKIKSFKEEGTSLLFVSHDKSAILSLCDRAILLNDGNIAKDGNPEEVLDFYNALIAEKEYGSISQKKKECGRTITISGNNKATIQEISLCNMDSCELDTVSVGEYVSLNIKVKTHEDIEELVLGYSIKDRLGLDVYGTNTYHLNDILYDLKKDQIIDYSFKFYMNVGLGTYSIAASLHKGDTHLIENYEWQDNAYVFNVVNVKQKTFIGMNWIEPNLEYSVSELK